MILKNGFWKIISGIYKKNCSRHAPNHGWAHSLHILESKYLVPQVLTLGWSVLQFQGVVERGRVESDDGGVDGLHDVPRGEGIDEHEDYEPNLAKISLEDIPMVRKVGPKEYQRHLQIRRFRIINILCHPWHFYYLIRNINLIMANLFIKLDKMISDFLKK